MKNKLRREDTPCLPPNTVFKKSFRLKYILNPRLQVLLRRDLWRALLWHLSQVNPSSGNYSVWVPALLQLCCCPWTDVSPAHPWAILTARSKPGWGDRSAALLAPASSSHSFGCAWDTGNGGRSESELLLSAAWNSGISSGVWVSPLELQCLSSGLGRDKGTPEPGNAGGPLRSDKNNRNNRKQ